MRCSECGSEIRLVTGPGRTRELTRGVPLQIPSDFPTPVCSGCGEEYMIPEVSDPLDLHLRQLYPE